MKILIVRLSSIGDIIHNLPALAAIRCALPDARISWVAEKRAAEILRGNPLLDALIEIDTRGLRERKSLGASWLAARRQIRRLRAEKFDLAIDFQGLLKSAGIAKLSGARRRCGFAREALREPASRFLLTEKYAVPARAHVIIKNLTLARKALKISVPSSPEDFEFPIASEEKHRAEAAALVARVGANFAVLNPAGGWATKLWAAENFGALADRLWEEQATASVIAVAPQEKALAERVLRASRSGKAFAATPSLKGFYELAKHARVYVGGDTGPTHLAVAAGAPVVGIFGPTEWWYNGSPNPLDICVERTDIGCRTDCRRRACSNWICLDIEVERVAEAVRKRIKREAAAAPARAEKFSGVF
jgi:lipopolysaccharide heptosyltransferase I